VVRKGFLIRKFSSETNILAYVIKGNFMNFTKNILSVVIPVYNEEKTISTVIDEVLSRDEVAEIILIDDASADQSTKVIETYLSHNKIKLLRQTENMGKGAAIRKGFGEATAPIVIIQDADLEYSPQEYKTMLKPILDGKADVVYGSRFQGGPGRVLYYRHQLGNKLLTFLSNIFTDLNFTDIETCYKAFKREVVQNINLESDRFGIEVELTAKIAKVKGLRIYEVPISYNGRTYSEGKKITWKDGVAALWHIIKFNLLKSSKTFYKEDWEKILKK
jgi:glycosyltransferase involved in cell wall biosynthesis